ncbi:pentapeptide repeat-containing protein [Microlunatus speluncae]|uniref:pentapeptide repeat-containing protein n=1 Tax=Microlunatus speluncae TaxID=2594267 RepID=UPI0013761076|nr:pentapeptide repeat-containing protein [Microlunatus speluncae]
MEPKEPKPPKISKVTLGELTTPDHRDVLDGDMREGERYVRADFTDRDLDAASFTGCEFDQVQLMGANLRGAHFTGGRWSDVDAPVLRGPRSSWRRMIIARSRIGSAELYESNWRDVTITDSKLGYLNLRGSEWRDVIISDCGIDELDLNDATVTRLAFRNCQVGTLGLNGAKLTDVDLRGADLATINGLAGIAGATISDLQLMRMGPLLARHLQLNVIDD